MPTTEELEEMLRGATLRVTRPRLAVLEAVHTHPHADTDALLSASRRSLGEVSHQAVYDVLRALTAAGLVRRIQPSGSVARYESRVADNHHHVVCRSCGTIADVDCAVGSPRASPPPITTASRSTRPRSSTGAPAPPVPPHAPDSPDSSHPLRKDPDDREPGPGRLPGRPRRRHRDRQREREPRDRLAHPEGTPAADQQGLVARPARPLGPAPPPPGREPAGQRLQLPRGVLAARRRGPQA